MNFCITRNCPNCNEMISVDLANKYTDIDSTERQMGPEITYTYDNVTESCPKCLKNFSINGNIWEYPMDAYNDDDIVFDQNED